jgi:hypothetical protein
MATNPKDFKVKHGLIVEGAQGTINNQTILTETDGDAYILGLVGGATLITSVDPDDFTVTAGLLTVAAGSDIARDGDITTAIDALDTDDIEEGASNQYFTNQRALDATSAAYDPAGAAGDVASDLTDHENATEAHGATGAVVGTTNTQSLSNKTISYVDNTITVQVANVSDLTASAAELNTLDGITASTSELNLLDGVTATTTELNYVDGVTSGIQSQLNDKAPLASPALTGTPSAPTATPGTNSTQIATTAYADAAVAALVDGAPELLNTLNELAAAINDDETFATTVAGLVADKQDTLTAGSNIDITGATISVTGLDSADISDFNTAAVTANTGLWDTIGAAAQALSDAEDYADNLDTDDVAEGATNQYFTNQRALDATASAYDATGTAQGIVDALDTDDIEEGATNLYFTDARASSAVATALGATNASSFPGGSTNTQVYRNTSTGEIRVYAENGVADSTTDDLDEGSTNLYFTDARAQGALNQTTPNFTAVEIESLAKQVAATTSVATASQVTAYEFLGTEYRSAKFLVKTAQGSHTEVSEVLLTMDASNNIAITEYAMVGTNGSLMTITADYVSVGTTVRLRVTTLNNTSEVTVFGTLLA